jgi:predicted outer membrane repeat protein
MKITRLGAIIPLTIAVVAQFGGAYAATLTVCPSGCEHTTIQGAISHASNGDTISIGKGHYFETINTQGKALTLQGINNRQVVIDANGTGSVVTIPGSELVTITGVTITRGSTTQEGGGINITDGADLNLTNSDIVSNLALVGGGLWLSYGKTVNITNCTIADNQSGFTGGGIEDDGPTLNVSGSTIARNVGGGIAVNGESRVIVTVNNSSVVDNTEYGGIAVYSGQGGNGPVTIKNSTIAGNSSVYGGGGVVNDGSIVSLENVVLTRNNAAGQGGGIYSQNGGLRGGHTPTTTLKNTYIILNSAAVDGGGTYLNGNVVNDGDVVVSGNLPDNCGKGTICP